MQKSFDHKNSAPTHGYSQPSQLSPFSEHMHKDLPKLHPKFLFTFSSLPVSLPLQLPPIWASLSSPMLLHLPLSTQDIAKALMLWY